jgi:MYXO-CTERM domain-containing protein
MLSGPVRRLALFSAIAALSWSANASAAQQLGFNVHQSSTTGLSATKDASLKWVRIDLNWFDAEPQQGNYNFAPFDALINAATAKGLNVLAVLAYTPAWASAGNARGDSTNNDVPNAGTYASFVTAVVNRYKSKVTHYELWNEPNLGEFFEGTPQDYTSRVLVPGAQAVHAACPACKVVAPGLASIGSQYATWMDASLAAAKNDIDIVSGHIYAQFTQDDPGAGTTSDSFFNKLESHRVVKVGTVTVYEGPLSFREVMAKHNVTKPFWLTETGKTATPGNAQQEDAQKLYYRRVLEAMLTRPWWDATIFYEGFDVPNSGYTWGIVVEDGAQPSGYRKKAVFDFLKRAAEAQPAFGGNKTDCDDGLDNDGDDKIDFPADPECTSAGTASEGVAPPPGGDGGAPAADGGGSASGGAPPPPGSGEGATPRGDDGSGAGSRGTSSGSDGGCSATGTGANGHGAAVFVLIVAAALSLRRRSHRGREASRRRPPATPSRA